jgi:gamma-glutamyltranspeptidase/glutathione hydrolase/leukotriene-C4 hydrolase
MKDLPEFTEIYAPNGTFVKPGEIIKNVALSKTLQTIATKGADSFYKVKYRSFCKNK